MTSRPTSGVGSVARFVADMNADARQALGLTHTHYENPIGLGLARELLQPL